MDSLIGKIIELDNNLYKTRYYEKNHAKNQLIWDGIKKNRKMLETAFKL